MRLTRQYKAPRQKRRQSGAGPSGMATRGIPSARNVRRKKGARDTIVRFALVRHGLTQANVERRYISYTDNSILPQASEELRPLRRALAHPAPLLYTSDMRRCRETIAYLRPRDGGEASVDTRLREYDFGMWEGLTYNDLKEEPQYRKWLDDMSSVQPPRGEPWQSFCTRTAHVWWEILRNARAHVRSVPEHAGRTGRRNRPPRTGGKRNARIRTGRSAQGSSCRMARPDVLVVTHGGIVRRLHTLAFPRKSFWETAAPIGGGVMITAKRCARKWVFLRAERFPSP